MATEFDTARSTYEGYRFCYDNMHAEWVAKAAECFRFWRGGIHQWSETDRAKLIEEGRPVMTFNIIESLVRTMKGIQRALRNDVRFAPTHDASLEDAQAIDAIWMQVLNENQFDFLETDVFEKGLIMSASYYDVRVEFEENLQGSIRITSPRSQDIVRYPSATTYDPKSWPGFFHKKWVNYVDLLGAFGKEKTDAIVAANGGPGYYDYEDRYMAQQMGDLPYYKMNLPGNSEKFRAYLLLDHQYAVIKRKEFFVDLDTGDMKEIPENWDYNRISHVKSLDPRLSTMHRKAKTIRWDVVCDGTVLHSEDSIYNSYTIVPYFPSFVDGIAKGAVEDLIDPQQLYNKITSSELHIISTTANSGWLMEQGGVLNMKPEEVEENGSKAGVVFLVKSTETSLKKIQPNQTPQGHDRISFKADKIMRSISGVSDQARGFAREDVAGDAILSNQAAQDVNFAGCLSNLHRTKQLLAARVLDCVQAFYTEERAIMVNRGTPLVPDVQTLSINQRTPEGNVLNDVTRGKYMTTLVPSPSRTTMSESDFKLMMELRQLGIQIPDKLLIELSPASNKSQIIQSLVGDSSERENAAAASAAQAAQVQQQKDLASAKKEEAAALLNQARAEKATVEAQTDPDAAYTEVELTRIDEERRQFDEKHALDTRIADDNKQLGNRELAVELTKIDAQQKMAKENAKNKPPVAKKGK